MPEEYLSKKIMRAHTYNLFFGQKRPSGGPKMDKKISAVFVKRPFKPMGKIFQAPKKIENFFFFP